MEEVIFPGENKSLDTKQTTPQSSQLRCRMIEVCLDVAEHESTHASYPQCKQMKVSLTGHCVTLELEALAWLKLKLKKSSMNTIYQCLQRLKVQISAQSLQKYVKTTETYRNEELKNKM